MAAVHEEVEGAAKESESKYVREAGVFVDQSLYH
jgi:hypothetical protein